VDGIARRRQYLRRASYVHIDDGQVLLAFPYDPDLVAAARVIPGRRYDAATHVNSYPLSSLPAVVGVATKAGIDIAPEVLAVARDVALNPDAYTPVEVYVSAQDPQILRIDTDYDRELGEALRALNGHSTWRPAARVHEIAIAAGAARLLELVDAKNLKVDPWAEEQLRAAAEASSAMRWAWARRSPAWPRWPPTGHTRWWWRASPT
jgi:hypothetical protein